jgi:hypothetical protein
MRVSGKGREMNEACAWSHLGLGQSYHEIDVTENPDTEEIHIQLTHIEANNSRHKSIISIKPAAVV